MERYLYHSFPRREARTNAEQEKGVAILRSLCDSGLLLVPEYIEWKQPTVNGNPRIFPVLQTRVCFTDLSPSELPQHAEKFGQFALEFEYDTARKLGAIPVFYVPQPVSKSSDGNALGVALVAIAVDTHALVHRISSINSVLNGPIPVQERIDINTGFVRSPDDRSTLNVNSHEMRVAIEALSHGMTPLQNLEAGANALLNFFYPADDTAHDKALDYYKQREWRIACRFSIDGREVLRGLSEDEKKTLLIIDREFFSRTIKTDTGDVEMLSAALIHPGLGDAKILEMARRIIVPNDAVAEAKQLLSGLKSIPEIVAINTLADSA